MLMFLPLLDVRYFALLLLLALSAGLDAQMNAPGWQSPPPTQFDQPGTETVTAAVRFSSNFSMNVNDEVAVFFNGSIRGAGTVIGPFNSPATFPEDVYFTLTISGNTAEIGQAFEFRVYHAATDQIYVATPTINFAPPTNRGSFQEPFVLDIGAQPDQPVDLRPLPDQVIVAGTFAFDPIDLDTLTDSHDGDPVAYSINPLDAGITFSLDGSLLRAQPDPGFVGEARVEVTATEQTATGLSDSEVYIYRVVPDLDTPVWETLPPQTAARGDTFPSFDLDTLITYDDCYVIDYQPQFSPGLPDTFVTWSAGDVGSFSNTMTITASVAFTPNLSFDHPGDRLAAFINDDLRGVASPTDVMGQPVFFLNVANAGTPDTVDLLFFSGALRQVFVYPLPIIFMSGAQIGTAANPDTLDFSPFNVMINEGNELSVTVRNPEVYSGLQAYTFTAAHCEFPDDINSTMTVPFCYALDNMGSSPPAVLRNPPPPACEVKKYLLSNLVASDRSDEGFLYTWFTEGDGVFLDADRVTTNDYATAMFYQPGPQDGDRNEVKITLSVSTGPVVDCEETSVTVILPVLDVDSGNFPYDGR